MCRGQREEGAVAQQPTGLHVPCFTCHQPKRASHSVCYKWTEETVPYNVVMALYPANVVMVLYPAIQRT